MSTLRVSNNMQKTCTRLGSLMATTMFVYTLLTKLLPPLLRARLREYTRKLTSFFYPYIRITFHEFTGEHLIKSEVFSAIQTYLSEHFSQRATRLKAETVRNRHNPFVLTMDDNEEITQEFQGVKVWWVCYKTNPKTRSFSIVPSDERRYYELTFHQRHRKFIAESYLKHVLDEAKAIEIKNRQLKLYTNHKSRWSHVMFEHHATFETLAMDPKVKEDVVNDLEKFKSGKEYYARIGKAWKRGYLLYGPPGTGKSTMIAAMANFMNYHVYDLELTAVKDNSDLRMLLLTTRNKSIIVIEDIDCSLDLTGQRKKKKRKEGKVKKSDDDDDDDEGDGGSKVTLSGLLNVVDGIWSACGGERIIIFTTNFVEKLDPALIRRGRMDKHIEMSYCCYEAFKILAKNYLDVESHDLFDRIKKSLEETNVSPADVAENLMPKSVNEDDVDTCLLNLIHAIEIAKEDAEKAEEKQRKKTEEKQRKKAESNIKANENHGERIENENSCVTN